MLRKELRLICKERGIKYVTNMNKPKMVYILQQNDEDSSKKVHIIVQDRLIARMHSLRESDDYIEKERQYKREWDKRNPDKVAEYQRKYTQNPKIYITPSSHECVS